MHDIDQTPDLMHRARVALDWTVFTLGVLSLSTAIIATVLTKTHLLGSDQSPPSEEQTVRNG